MELLLSFFLFFCSIYLIFFQKLHFLSILLVMELMTLSLFMVCCFLFGFGTGLSSVSFCIIFIVFGVYEAANGLGLLVSRSRSDGLDSLKGLFCLSF